MTLTDCHTCGCSEVICREAPERGFTKCCPDCRHTPRMTARDDLAVLLCSAVSHGQGKDVRWIPCEAHVWQADAVIREWLPTQTATIEADAADQRGGYQAAAAAADRFRDVLSECLGHEDENPGDDVLVAELRAHFGKSGPEPRRWRDFMVGANAMRDQIIARREERRS